MICPAYSAKRRRSDNKEELQRFVHLQVDACIGGTDFDARGAAISQ